MAQEAKHKEVLLYEDERGKKPFTVWIESLRDARTRRRILQRIMRVEDGNYGDYKSLKDGLYEMRLHFGSGYRVYFGEDGETVVILLCGGDKSTQKKDIEIAKSYWKEYKDHG